MLVPLPPLSAIRPSVTSRIRLRGSAMPETTLSNVRLGGVPGPRRSYTSGRVIEDRPSDQREGEAEFLAAYDPSQFPRVAVTADVVLLTVRAGRLSVLLVQRKGHPYRGHWALPGGFVEPDDDLD